MAVRTFSVLTGLFVMRCVMVAKVEDSTTPPSLSITFLANSSSSSSNWATRNWYWGRRVSCKWHAVEGVNAQGATTWATSDKIVEFNQIEFEFLIFFKFSNWIWIFNLLQVAHGWGCERTGSDKRQNCRLSCRVKLSFCKINGNRRKCTTGSVRQATKFYKRQNFKIFIISCVHCCDKRQFCRLSLALSLPVRSHAWEYIQCEDSDLSNIQYKFHFKLDFKFLTFKILKLIYPERISSSMRDFIFLVFNFEVF